MSHWRCAEAAQCACVEVKSSSPRRLKTSGTSVVVHAQFRLGVQTYVRCARCNVATQTYVGARVGTCVRVRAKVVGAVPA